MMCAKLLRLAAMILTIQDTRSRGSGKARNESAFGRLSGHPSRAAFENLRVRLQARRVRDEVARKGSEDSVTAARDAGDRARAFANSVGGASSDHGVGESGCVP
jgi:hypothetical protein